MENLYCTITGRRAETMKLKLFLRLLNLLVLGLIRQFFGMDWVFIVGFIILAADLDHIAEVIDRKFGKHCKRVHRRRKHGRKN